MEHAAQYGNDIKRIVESYQEFERSSDREYVNFEPRRVPVVKASEESATYCASTDGDAASSDTEASQHV